jgi:F-type H+-transporting ATPase subunit gamma
MASLKDIRKRIQSVKNTRQITRAMKMVAAAKLRRAQDAVVNARPFAYRIYSILLGLVERDGITHPLLEVREEKKIRVVILAGDRGLCGAYNANVYKAATKFIKAKQAAGVTVVVDTIGRKAFEFAKKRYTLGEHHEGLLTKSTYSRVAGVADKILAQYIAGHEDAVYLVYNEFKSAIQQTVVTERLVPISTEVPDGVVALWTKNEAERLKEKIYEPSEELIWNELVPRHFKMQLFRAVLESVASEHGSRMSAMENATKNASEMIEILTLDYNKARQASITKELMEIVGGVEAMR